MATPPPLSYHRNISSFIHLEVVNDTSLTPRTSRELVATRRMSLRVMTSELRPQMLLLPPSLRQNNKNGD